MARRPLATGLLVFLILAVAFFLGTYLTAWLIERPASASDQIALVRIEGVIMDADEPVEQLRTFAENPAITERFAARIPVGRLGRPEEVADLTLAVIANGYVTGQTISIDGGSGVCVSRKSAEPS